MKVTNKLAQLKNRHPIAVTRIDFPIGSLNDIIPNGFIVLERRVISQRDAGGSSRLIGLVEYYVDCFMLEKIVRRIIWGQVLDGIRIDMHSVPTHIVHVVASAAVGP